MREKGDILTNYESAVIECDLCFDDERILGSSVCAGDAVIVRKQESLCLQDSSSPESRHSFSEHVERVAARTLAQMLTLSSSPSPYLSLSITSPDQSILQSNKWSFYANGTSTRFSGKGT